MTDFLVRHCIRDSEKTRDPRVRRAYGTLSGSVGIVLNALLCVSKGICGFLSGSLSLIADAFNNLSDLGTQLLTLLSARVSAKPADRKHPFGHARSEYLTALIMGLVILFVGVRLAVESLGRTRANESPDLGLPAICVLAISILVKLWMYHFNRRMGKKISSAVLLASATDSLCDAAATSAVLAALLVGRFTDFHADAWAGILVSVLIVVSSVRLLLDARNRLLGGAPSEETVRLVRETVAEFPGALGMHDLTVHNYGPGRQIVTLHVDVDGNADVFACHDVVDAIERALLERYDIPATIHMDPVVRDEDDPELADLRVRVGEIVSSLFGDADLHDFRLVRGTGGGKLIFDASVSYDCRLSDREIGRQIGAAVLAALGGRVRAVSVTVDRF